MSRKDELLKVKEVIKDNYDDAECGLFDTRNIIGDIMSTIFRGSFFQLDICYSCSYFELFGTTKKEFKEMKSFYESLRK